MLLIYVKIVKKLYGVFGLEVGRNDVCSCGSGKKYKKCCMKKAQVIEIGQVRIEQYFRHKFQLVERLNSEILSSCLGEYQTLKRQFEKRVKEPISEGFFNHWLLFYYQDENGKRGIERYNELLGQRDEQVLRELAKGWERLVPRLIQQVDYDERGAVVEDLFTKERFHMPYCETMKEWVPWAGTFCLIEEFGMGLLDINGIAVSVGPTDVKQAFDLLTNHLKEIESTYDQAARELYPEMLGALLSKRKVEEETREIIHTELHYDVQNMVDVLDQCRKDDHFRINEWDGSRGQGQFFKKMYRYEDNAAKGPIHLRKRKDMSRSRMVNLRTSL